MEPATPPPQAGLLDELSGALGFARATLSGFLELLSLEARRAGLALVWMAVWALVAALCIAGAWLGLMAALALCLVSLGAGPIAAVIVVAFLNLLAGMALIWTCVGLSRALLFSATRRQLAGSPPTVAGAP